MPFEKANMFIACHSQSVLHRYKPTYHFSPLIGWMNDPNGLVYAYDKYHLFYQYYPYQPKWGPMYWGHATSDDLLKWCHQPIALAPDSFDSSDLGCFSGTAISEQNCLYLMYTQTFKLPNDSTTQEQCLAVSNDGITFEKFANNPVIASHQVPEGYVEADFRDPKLFQRNGQYYCLIAACHKTTGGDLLLFRSHDKVHWDFVGGLFKPYTLTDGVFECPDIFSCDGYDVIVCSPQLVAYDSQLHSFQNHHSSVYFIGKLDLETGHFSIESTREIDSGFDFYAPQLLTRPDGTTAMIAWMNMWDRSYPTAEDGWVGSMTIPRLLQIRDGQIFQKPVETLLNYRKNPVSYKNIEVSYDDLVSFGDVSGTSIELELTVDLSNCNQFGLKVFQNHNNEALIYIDKGYGTITLDRDKSGESIRLSPQEEEKNCTRRKARLTECRFVKLQIFMDKTSIEVFVNDGERTLSATVFPSSDSKNIAFFCSEGKANIKELNKYDIVV